MEKRTSFAKELTAIFVKNKIIDEKRAHELQKSFKDSPKEYFDDFILEEGFVEEEDLLNALSQLYKVPAVDVVGYFFQSFLLHKFPKDVLHRYAFIHMDVEDDILTVVASEPDDPRLLTIIGDYVSYDAQFRVGLRRDITDSISEFYDMAVTEVPQDIDMRAERLDDRGFRAETLLKDKEEEEAIADEDVLD